MENIVLLGFGRSAFDEAGVHRWEPKKAGRNICTEITASRRGHRREAELSASERGKEREWKVPGKCLGCEENAGRIQALTTTNRRNLTRLQISEPHTWTCGGPDLNTAPCGSGMTLFLFRPPVSWGWGSGVQQGGVEGLILILDAFSDTLVLSLNYRDHKLHHNLTPDPVRASAGKRLWPKINTQSSHI